MCGVLAQFNKNTQVNLGLFNESLKLLNHRGPDDMDSALLRDNSICFGHTRLSVVGIDNGKQPLTSSDKSIVAIVNGEFYDYKKIKYDLSLDGYKFSTDTDSEIILALYKKHKYDCFKKLNGEFAGIIYDIQEDQLIIFRDRHGVKPLFFKKDTNGIILSSEIKSILKIANIEPEWNIECLKQASSLHGIQNHTIVKDIYHVKPAHYMVLNLKTNDFTEHCYWQIDYDRKNYLDLSLEELSQKYENEFVAAISRRLVADIPVATYLSGGIDSSACYAVASHITGKGADAFTISFEHPKYDEFALAQKLVNQYGGKHHVLKVDEKLLFDNFEQHLWNTEAVVLNPHAVAKYLLSKSVYDAGFKAVITGEGADEYNAGYAPSVIDAVKFEYNDDLNLSKDELSVHSSVMISEGAKELPLLKQIYGFSPTWYENAAVANNFFNNIFKERYQVADPDKELARWSRGLYREDMRSWDTLNTSLYLTSKFTFTYVLSVLGDRTEMAHSVEARLPFLDNNLISLLAKVPPKYKASPGVDKFLLREAVKKYVTPEHYNMPKHAYIAPPLLRKNSIFANYMHDVFSSVEFINNGLYDYKKVLDYLDMVINSDNSNPGIEKYLFIILSFAILNKQFGFKKI